MEILTKPYKFGSWQITKIIDKFGKEKIELKYFSKNKQGGLNWNHYQVLYIKLKDWKEFKSAIKQGKR